MTLWRDIETGEVVTYSEMCRILEEVYDFDDFTPWTEVYEYFEKVKTTRKQAN